MGDEVRKVLLLNPPGDRLYIRDQFCSHVSKGTYYWQPLDLLMLSATLDACGYELEVLDAIAERLSYEEALARLERFSPDAVVFLTGSDSFLEDFRFVEEAKRGGVRVTVGIGDILRENGERLLMEHGHVDACLTDFVIHGLDAFLKGRIDEAENMTVRDGNAIRKVPEAKRPRSFTIPPPRYDLFPLDRYRMPYNRYHPYATIITAIWCPYGCVYCPFARTPFKAREVDNVLENLEAIRGMGIRQLHIADWTFGVDRKRAEAILHGMIEADFGFTWSCLSRVDVMDREFLTLIRKAGCDLIEFGVEFGSQDVHNDTGKKVEIDRIRETFRITKELDLSTLATFVLGFPGETRETMQQTLDLALEIEPTFCSFNMASPRQGSQFRRDMIEAGMIDDEIGVELDSSRTLPVFSTPELTAEEVYAFRQRAIRKFYLRPSYILRRMRRLASWTEFQNYCANGLSLAWQSIQSARSGRA